MAVSSLKYVLPLLSRQAAGPVYWLEMRRRERSRGAAALLYRFMTPVILALAGLAVTVVTVITWISESLNPEWAVSPALGYSLIVMVLIQLIGGAAANILVIAETAPLISSEIELHSWGLLRSTTLTLQGILFDKLAAGLAQFRGVLTGLLTLRAASLSTAWVFMIYTIIDQQLTYTLGEIREFVANSLPPLLLASLIVSAVYLLQPIVQLYLNGALGLLTSTLTRTRGRATVGGLAGRLVIWIAVIIVNITIIYGLSFLFSNWSNPSYAMMDAYRIMSQPSPRQIAWATSLTVSLYMLGVLTSQVGLTLAALGLALRRARRLEV